MVGKIIREYFEGGNKKITVPGFGTFMRKESGEIIFVDLLRKDDGLLRGLVGEYGNYSEVDAMALVDRFIFEIKRNIERNGSAAIEGFGTMTLDDKGIYQFDYSPQAIPAGGSRVQEHRERVRPAEESRAGADNLRTAVSHKKSAPQTAVRQPVAERPAGSPESGRRPQAASRKAAPGRSKTKRSRPDTIIIIAIIAAIIAVLIIFYGASGPGFPFLE